MNLAQYLQWLLFSGNASKTGPTANAGTYALPSPLPDGAVFDDFDGAAGSPPSSLWTPIDGVPRGISVTAAENATLDGSGNLQLVAAVQPDSTWKSALVTTTEMLGYGTYAARIKMSGGHGLHQSFWALGQGYSFTDYASGTPWPQCGELDIMECIADGKYYSTVHGPMYQPPGIGNYNQSQLSGPFGFMPRLDYHVYWAKKLPGKAIHFGIDGMDLGAIGPASIPAGAPWELNQPMQSILSITVNAPSGWGGGIDDTTPDVATMLVDWFYFQPA